MWPLWEEHRRCPVLNSQNRGRGASGPTVQTPTALEKMRLGQTFPLMDCSLWAESTEAGEKCESEGAAEIDYHHILTVLSPPPHTTLLMVEGSCVMLNMQRG